MYPFYLELELIKPVSDYFKKQKYIVKYEVKIGFCRADIVAFKKDEVVAVELKLNNLKKAILQAKNYQLGVDYVYLAFPLMKSFNILRKVELKLKNEGIGLLIVNEKTLKVSKLINSKKSNINMGHVKLNAIKFNKHHEKFRRLY